MMTLREFSALWLVAAAAVLGLVAASGCGTGAYEKRLAARTQRLGQESEFAQAGGQVAVPGFPVSMIVPGELTQLPESADGRRLQPPFRNLEGRKLTFEGGLKDSEGGTQHYYLYVLASGAAGGGQSPLDSLNNQLAGALGARGGRRAQVEEVRAKTPDGRSIAWKQFHVEGNQEFFYLTPQGQEQYISMEGRVVVWGRLEEQAGCWVVLVWRVPTPGGQDYVGLDQKSQVVAGSVAGT